MPGRYLLVVTSPANLEKKIGRKQFNPVAHTTSVDTLADCCRLVDGVKADWDIFDNQTLIASTLGGVTLLAAPRFRKAFNRHLRAQRQFA